jgi:deoxyribodipyrimidine photo-lyase
VPDADAAIRNRPTRVCPSKSRVTRKKTRTVDQARASILYNGGASIRRGSRSPLMSQRVQLVWFKRDLRLEDHAPLAHAARAGTVLPLYVIDPEQLFAADFDRLHYNFLLACLTELRAGLASLGQPLIVRLGEITNVLRQIAATHPLAALWSHAENGTGAARARDERVRAWSREHSIPWYELPQNGVVRGLAHRDGWRRLWFERMSLPVARMPQRLAALPGLEIGSIPLASELGLSAHAPAVRGRKDVARGGESRGWALLDSFLSERGASYPRGAWSPLTAFQASSRLSPYLAWGCLSTRTVYQRTVAARKALAANGLVSPLGVPFKPGALEAFTVRLRTRCDHLQSLESSPAIETRCIDGACEELRSEDRAALMQAWCSGRTGYPLVDACMRALQAEGWLHFRGRALVASFAANQLWIDWRRLKNFLARQFLDYEPAVHFMELQTLSGSAGRRALKIYDPVRESRELDPAGEFIRRWIPELALVSQSSIHEPWTMTAVQQRDYGCRLGRDYPLPIVEQSAALAQARARLRQLQRLAPDLASGETLPNIDASGQWNITLPPPREPPPAP